MSSFPPDDGGDCNTFELTVGKLLIVSPGNSEITGSGMSEVDCLSDCRAVDECLSVNFEITQGRSGS